MGQWKLHILVRGILMYAVLASLPLTAQSKKTQAQSLVDRTAQKHSEISELEISAALLVNKIASL